MKQYLLENTIGTRCGTRFHGGRFKSCICGRWWCTRSNYFPCKIKCVAHMKLHFHSFLICELYFTHSPALIVSSMMSKGMVPFTAVPLRIFSTSNGLGTIEEFSKIRVISTLMEPLLEIVIIKKDNF